MITPGINVWRRLFIGSGLLLAAGLILDGAYIYAKAQLAQYLIEDAWQQTLSEQQPVRPWSWADTWPIAKLEVPDKAISLVILNGANGASLPFGPGHIEGSAAPGTFGSSLVAGHRDTHFAFLKNINKGDVIKIQNQKGLHVNYQVYDLKVADSRKQTLTTQKNTDELKLITCYPFNAIDPGGPLRYIVSAQKIPFRI